MKPVANRRGFDKPIFGYNVLSSCHPKPKLLQSSNADRLGAVNVKKKSVESVKSQKLFEPKASSFGLA
ncbi:MAG: hypothetical protein PHR20_02920 [Bacteroidales bacterium]|nr:hypothetical protein [Bacteroidales bacterium]